MTLSVFSRRLHEAPDGVLPPRLKHRGNRLLGGILLLALAFNLICVVILIEARRDAWSQAEAGVRNLANVLSRDIGRNIELIDLTLQGVVDNLRQPGVDRMDPSLRQRLLFQSLETINYLDTIVITTARGEPRLDSRSLSPLASSVAGKEFFLAQQRQDQGLYIGLPERDPVSGKLYIPLSRRLNGINGSFAGIVYGLLDMAYFKNLLYAIELGERGTITLIRADGRLLVRYPYIETQFGKDVRPTSLFNHYPAAQSGLFQTVASLDQIERLYAFQGLERIPVAVSVGRAVDTVYASWRQRALALSGIMVLLSGALITLALLLRRSLQRHDQDHQNVVRSELLLRGALHGAGIGTALVDLKGAYAYVNPALSRMTGYAPEDFAHMRIGAMTYPDDRDLDREQLGQLQKGELDFYEIEKRYQRKDGSLFWGLRSVSLVRDEDEQPLYIIAQLQDIDARKQAEASRDELLRRLSIATRAGGIAIWEYDPNQRTLQWDERAHTLLGLPTDKPHANLDVLLSLMTPEDRADLLTKFDALATHDFMDDEFRLYLPDGTLHYIHTLAEVIRDPKGRPERVIGAAWDITLFRTLTEALSEEKNRLQVTLDSIGDAVITTDEQGHILFMNPVAEHMTGWPEAEACQRPLADVFQQIDADSNRPLPDPVQHCLTERRVIHGQTGAVLIDRNGQHRDVQHTAAPVRTDAGEIIGAVLVFQDVTRARELQRRLSHSASHDPLTQLLNRAAFEQRLEAAIQSARDDNTCHTLAFIDLDRFKIVNDTAGHAAGDALLRELATLLRSHLRTTDTVARLGGDEFALILSHCSLEEAQKTLDTLVARISAFQLPWEGQLHNVGASIGITAINATTSSAEMLVRQADEACYAAKHSGRNRVCRYQPAGITGAASPSPDENSLLALVREARATGRFRLMAQRIDAPNGPLRYELLLRLLDHNNQLLMPDRFLPLAERYHLMSEIDSWVLQQALTLLTGPAANACLHINLSTQALSDPVFTNRLIEHIQAAHLRPGSLIIEITHITLRMHLTTLAPLFSQLSTLGCQVALDHFGTGLSLFSYLRTFPIKMMKIDSSLIQGMLDNPVDRHIIHALHQIAQELGTQTSAEHVESDLNRKMLEEMGITCFQGFDVHRPEPVETVFPNPVSGIAPAAERMPPSDD
ncbi:PAS domain S-box-containing protein/diguanylate cyclase (GGDEF)-like protein [Pseudomonas duriflava]|uniref:PAS domain S-box-containing protein/diguanylate cyclase (GGDEF)-like protein n=1 Tax=Pseudomonas duriflava TaxID=459528 RepID=A0A562QLF3_9PSED|nr:EAL domain-containing protein [Pseudomonas duriflava]TWI57503.1 PAS domain S-box-containing protein/diguanylate cyclase (GGDEF)-like protein [Pseudomonas duriflava]